MKKVLLATVIGALLLPLNAFAITLSLHSSNVGITGFDYTVDGTKITIYEDWTEVGRGFVEFRGLEADVDYTICKVVYNNTGVDWDRFSHELLDPAGDNNDATYDPATEAWVPAGFSHSNDNDGLSFAQGSGIPRTSTVYTGLTVDELAHARDFLDFHSGGSISGAGGTDTFSYGLRDSNPGSNQPFLLAQRPNESAIPEPGTLLLIGGGLMGLAARRRRR